MGSDENKGLCGPADRPSGRPRPWGRRPTWAAGDRAALLADSELVDQTVIALLVLALQVVEQAPALAHQHHEPPTGVVVLGVGLEVLRQVIDPLAQEGHLDLRRPRIARVRAITRDDRGFLCLAETHRLTSAFFRLLLSYSKRAS